MPWSTGDLLSGKYRLERRLGAGAAAEAWEAENVLLGRTVAVKILHEHLAKSASTRAHFLSEARAAARIVHPNVVSVFDIGLADEGVPFIVMELCDGEALSTVVDGRGPMGVSYAVDLVSQVLSGLHAAHELGIVHRDLKPDNLIVVHPRPDQPIVKVLDFGIAQGVFAEGHTEDGAVFGTPEYMPPEQACGESVDARADIYAAGVILYELLTGTVPFACDTPARTLARMLATAPEPPSRTNAAIPLALEHVVLSALEKNPAARPQTAMDFVSAIAPFGTASKPSMIPRSDSEAPLPLVTERKPPSAPGSAPGSPRAPRLELIDESSPPDAHPLRDRKA
ncbi:MAG TPA: serine/threonine-protein kinase [Polyangiaceae bacterium]|nr:serine/threonine-protein kinase [Polyangiaceae bacterium]